MKFHANVFYLNNLLLTRNLQTALLVTNSIFVNEDMNIKSHSYVGTQVTVWLTLLPPAQ
jgi:hypothetical protein